MLFLYLETESRAYHTFNYQHRRVAVTHHTFAPFLTHYQSPLVMHRLLVHYLGTRVFAQLPELGGCISALKQKCTFPECS